MQTSDYLAVLVEDIHSVVVATVDAQGHPASCVIDMMYQDGQTSDGLFFNRQYQAFLQAVAGKTVCVSDWTDTRREHHGATNDFSNRSYSSSWKGKIGHTS